MVHMQMIPHQRFTLAFSLIACCLLLARCDHHISRNPKVNKEVITVYDSQRFQPGYNIVNGSQGSEIYDMEGQLMMKFPGWICGFYETGEILATMGNDPSELHPALYDSDLNIVWEKKDTPAHHLSNIAFDGTIIVLSSEYHQYNNQEVRFDVILGYAKSGEELFRWSSFDHLESLIPVLMKEYPNRSEEDLRNYIMKDRWVRDGYEFSHNNYCQVIPENSLSGNNSAFSTGNLLVNMHPFFMMVLDRDNYEVLWHYRLPYNLVSQNVEHNASKMHTVQMLPTGNILVFDNGHLRGYSSVIEVDPVSKKAIWEYKADPLTSLHTKTMGACFRLKNGNTLITESLQGRAFEVTPEKQVVWEWLNPHIDVQNNQPEKVFWMWRVDTPLIADMINRNS